MKDTKADELTNALADMKLAAKPAEPMTTMASVSRRKRGWPFLIAMQVKKQGTVRKSDAAWKVQHVDCADSTVPRSALTVPLGDARAVPGRPFTQVCALKR